MGNSSSTTLQTYQQMTPAQQQAFWIQYQAQMTKVNADLKNMSSRQTQELNRIQKIQNELKNQYTMMSPLNTSNNLDAVTASAQGTAPYAPPMNQQPVAPTPPSNILPSTQSPGLGQPLPPSSVVNTCVSTANGGRCSLTLQALASTNSTCRFTGQTDGNLVIYNSQNTPLWTSATSGKGTPPYNLMLQPTGNLTWTDSLGNILWQTNTANMGLGPYTVSMNQACTAEMTDSKNSIIWKSNTFGN